MLVAVLALAGMVGGVYASGLRDVDAPPWWALLALVATLVAAGFLHVNVRRGDEVEAVDLFEAALAPAIFLVPGGLAVAMAALAKGLAEAALRTAPLKASFNVAQWAAATAAGCLVMGLAPAGRSAAALTVLAAAMVAVTGVNYLAFVTVLRLVEGRAPPRPSRPRPSVVPVWMVGSGLNLVVGLLLAAAFAWSPGTAPLFPAVLGVMHLAGRGYAATLADRARLRGLQRATRALVRHVDPAAAMPAFLSEVQASFDAVAAELLVVGEGGSVLHRVDDRGARRESAGCDRSVAALAFGRGVAVRATDGAGDPEVAQRLRWRGHRDVLAVPVHSRADAAGALCVYDRGGPEGEEDGAFAVLEALAGEVGQALDRQRLLDALRRSEARFRLLVQRSSDVVTVVDAGGTVQYVSPAVTRVLGLGEKDLVGRPFADVVHPADVPAVTEALGRSRAAASGAVSVTHRARSNSVGAWCHLDTVVTNLLQEPRVAGLVLHSRDATDRRRVESLLAGQAHTLEAVARDAPLGKVLRQVAGLVEGHSPGARAAVILRPGVQQLAVDPAPEVTAALLGWMAGGATASPGPTGAGFLVIPDIRCCAVPELVAPASAAGVRSVWALTTTVEHEAVGTIAVYHPDARQPDASERRVLEQAAHLARIAVERARARERLLNQATRDALTDLPNRALFLDHTRLALARAARRPSKVAVMFIDLDRFKIVNDSLGHEAGDRTLVALAERLTSIMRPGDTVARFGGDEFTVLCDGLADEPQALDIAERVNRALSDPLIVEGRELFVTCSVGVALTDAPEVPPETLVENADAAMYRAKEAGGARCEVFHEGMRAASRHRLATHSALHRAVERGEFHVVYQPVVSLVTGRMVGAEALLRWRHPTRGVLGPDAFIGLAEDTGLIVPIGAHVLREACRQAQLWGASRDTLAVGVNLSARQFADPGLTDVVADALDTSGVDPAGIALEITESTLMDDGAATTASLHGLRKLGVRLTVDDFGTGYSSLSYLSRFPVDGLKVDRSFVGGLGTDRSDTAIVSAVIRLAHTLGLDAIAEGVERVEQASLLSELGCEAAQGFLFSPPVPADALDLDQAHRGQGTGPSALSPAGALFAGRESSS